MTKAAVTIGLILLLLLAFRGFLKHSLFHFLEHLYEHHPDGFTASLGVLVWGAVLMIVGTAGYCVFLLLNAI